MQVTRHKVVAIDYRLTDDDGQMIDTSEGAEPLHYLHGEGNIIPGLEDALDGKSIGDQFQISIQPADGYGDRVDELRQVVSRDNFSDIDDLEVGMQFRVPADDNSHLVVTVVGIGGDTVTIDGNHQLAGVTLNFDITIRDVRDATSEEIEHGHAHAAGGHD